MHGLTLRDETQCTTVRELMDVSVMRYEDVTYAAKRWVDSVIWDLEGLPYGKGIVTRTPLSHKSRKRGYASYTWRLLDPRKSTDEDDARELEFFHRVLPFMLKQKPTRFRAICEVYEIPVRQPFFIVSLHGFDRRRPLQPTCAKPSRLSADNTILPGTKRLARETRKNDEQCQSQSGKDGCEDDDVLL